MQIDELARQFSEAVQQRGAALQRAGLVMIDEFSATSIRAVAIGTEDYDVRIDVDDRTLVLSCSCPAFDNDGPCKHLWATALVAAERRMLAAMPSWTKVKLTPSGFDRDTDGTIDEVVSVAPSRVVLRPGSLLPLRLPGEGEPPRPRSRVPEWESLFFPSGHGHAAHGSLPVSAPPAEILYVVEVDKTRQSGELTVSLRTRATRKKGGFAKDRAAVVPVDAAGAAADARDRRALPLLQAAATLSGLRRFGLPARTDTDMGTGTSVGSRPRPAIPTGMADELMPLLAETGRLFMRREPNGRARACDVRRRSAVGVRPRAFPPRARARARQRRARSPGCSSGARRAFPCPRLSW